MHCPCLDNDIHNLEHGQGEEGAAGVLGDLVKQDSDQTEANTQARKGLQPLPAPPPHHPARTSWTLLAGWNILWQSAHHHFVFAVLSSLIVADLLVNVLSFSSCRLDYTGLSQYAD